MTPQEKAKIQIQYYTRVLNGESYKTVNKDLMWKSDSFDHFLPCGLDNEEPGWCRDSYQWKPKTITVNGNEVPAPMEEYPEMGSKYFSLGGFDTRGCLFVVSVEWAGSQSDEEVFKYGIFPTKDQAEEYFNALIPKVRG